MTFTFDEEMMVHALEANGWRNVWDIYWVLDEPSGFCSLTTEDAFIALLRGKNLLPPGSPAAEARDQPTRRPFSKS